MRLAQTLGPTVGRRWIRRMVAALRVNQPESSSMAVPADRPARALDHWSSTGTAETRTFSAAPRGPPAATFCSACASPSDAGPGHAGPAIASPLAGRSREPVPAEAPGPASPPHRWSGGNAPPTQGRGDAREDRIECFRAALRDLLPPEEPVQPPQKPRKQIWETRNLDVLAPSDLDGLGRVPDVV